MDIRPPKNWKPVSNGATGQAPTTQTAPSAKSSPERAISSDPPTLPAIDEPISPLAEVGPRRRKRWPFVLASGLSILMLVLGGAFWWYTDQLRPVDPHSTSGVRFEVKEGTSFADLAKQLKARGLIRGEFAFDLLARLQGKRDSIKASTCSLKQSESSQEILDKLNVGCHDFKSVTFFPGGTIEKPLYKPEGATLDQVMYVKYVLQKSGYSDAQIASALTKQYVGPIFADKPVGSTLEGYIFGETYYVSVDATADEVLQTAFDQFSSVVEKNSLVEKFRAQGLNLYQGITLASIVQRELNCEDKPTAERKTRCYGYQQQIAQVFLNRLRQGMTLGSDVTFIYAADMLGVPPSPELDSPYNTRIHAGLPPGPVASPGELALKAVADPAQGDYLFFIAGDDGLIYFAHTNAEHEANIQRYCKELCKL